MSNASAPDKNDMQTENMSPEQQADAAFAEEATREQREPANEVQQLTAELRQANDRALRAQAELENFRKRMRREMDDERRYAALAIITDLLPVVDNLERAIGASENTPAGEDLVRGVKMVQSQFLSVLERHHCRRIGEVGEVFDPTHHQAIAQEPSSEFAAGSVTRVAQFGYQLHDRVVRPAQVFVSTGPAQTS